MTTLENAIRIDAPPDRVWSVLASLEALERYDPGVRKSEVLSPAKEGPGASRRCELAAGGWFAEEVVEWRPHEALAFELTSCSLPVRRLRHAYTLTPDGPATLVRQRMEYDLKLGPLGRLLDALVVRKKWDASVKAFFDGLKRHVEDGPGPLSSPGPR